MFTDNYANEFLRALIGRKAMFAEHGFHPCPSVLIRGSCFF